MSELIRNGAVFLAIEIINDLHSQGYHKNQISVLGILLWPNKMVLSVSHLDFDKNCDIFRLLASFSQTSRSMVYKAEHQTGDVILFELHFLCNRLLLDLISFKPQFKNLPDFNLKFSTENLTSKTIKLKISLSQQLLANVLLAAKSTIKALILSISLFFQLFMFTGTRVYKWKYLLFMMLTIPIGPCQQLFWSDLVSNKDSWNGL